METPPLSSVSKIIQRVLNLNLAVTYDEAFTFNHYASRSIAVILTEYTYPNNHIFHNNHGNELQLNY